MASREFYNEKKGLQRYGKHRKGGDGSKTNWTPVLRSVQQRGKCEGREQTRRLSPGLTACEENIKGRQSRLYRKASPRR